MTLSEELVWRGQIKDYTFAKLDWLDQPQTFYLGADCNSADSLTIGNLAIYMLARRLQQHGWKAVMLVGGATSLIGDPGGKDAERPAKTREEIQVNIAGITQQIEHLFGHTDFTLVDNYDWFKDIGYLEFLRDVGKHYSMTELLQREYITERLGEGGTGISYAEFSYSLIQGYDYWHLYKEHGVVLQIGGSDQWGNMLSGVPLVRKKEAKEVHALSMPLIIDQATGKKFGKSEAGAVWLDPAQTSPTQFYQFWMNVDDAGVEAYLKIYTEFDQPAIEQIMQQHQADPSARIAQQRLAEAVTSLVHGADNMALAQRVTSYLIGQAPVAEVDAVALEALRQEIATARTAVDGSVVAALVQTGLASSNSDARRLLQSNAINLNGQQITRDQFTAADFQNGRLLLRKGKKFRDSALIEAE